MNPKEAARNAGIAAVVIGGAVFYGKDAAGEVQDVIFPTSTPEATRTFEPTPTPTAKPEVRRTAARTATRTATQTVAPTPEQVFIVTPIPTLEPQPQPQPQPTLRWTPNPRPIRTQEPPPPPPPTPEPTQPSFTGLNLAEEQRLLELANSARAENGLVLFNLNTSLKNSGEQKATFLRTNYLYNHCVDIDRDGDIDYADSPQGLAEQAGYIGGAGEVLAAGNTADEVFERWKSSPGHWAALMNPNARDIGFGFYQDSIGATAVGEIGIPDSGPWHTC